MNINFGLQHLLLWQTYHFCNWISAVPLEKPTIPSNSVGNSSETKGDLFTDKHIEKPATINGNYSAVVTTTLKTFSLPIQANDAKRTPKLSNELSTTEWPANHSNIDFKDNGSKSAFLKNQHGTSKEHNLRLSNKSLEDRFGERMVRDKISTTEVYNELDLFQTTKSENATLMSKDNSTTENNTMIYENETNHNLSSSIEATNFSTNITENTNLTTTEMTYSQTINANTLPATKDDVISVSKTSSPQTQEQTTHEYQVLHHFTGFAQNVPVRSQYPHHNHHHLNLVPMEDSPFGNLLWKDKKYLISILVPISIGIVGAGCIIGMAYMARFCYRNERQIQIIKERVTQPQETNTDNIVLLEDSDDEF